jgi:transmembrane sensor
MDDLPEPVRAAAAAWVARMRGPDAEASRSGFEAWRAARAEHAAAYRQLEQRWEQMRFIGNLGVVRDRDLSRAAIWHRRASVRAAAACIALVAIGSVALLVITRPPATGATRQIAYASRVGEIRSIALADGSRITLDAGSAITIGYVGAERRAELVRGRARFSVTGSDARPFVVTAKDVTVTGRDADFDIDLARTTMHVALLRGDALVRDGGAATGKPASVWRLRAGQQIVPSGGARPQSAAPEMFGWTGGMLSFDGERLDDAIAALNRYNATHVMLDEPSIASLRITGAFHANDPRGFASAVAAMFRLQVVASERGLILSPAKKL